MRKRNSTELKSSVKKLLDAYGNGKTIAAKLEKRKESKYYSRGEFTRVGRVVGEATPSGKRISGEMARKMVAFTKLYTQGQLNTLVQQCNNHGFALGFDAVIKLLPIKSTRLRSKLQLLAIKNRWTKRELVKEIERQKATDYYKRRDKAIPIEEHPGKLPQATSSVQALLDELNSDARKWSRISRLLHAAKDKDRVTAAQLPPAFKINLDRLVKTFSKFDNYEAEA